MWSGVRNGTIIRNTIYAEEEFNSKIEVFTPTGKEIDSTVKFIAPQRAKTIVNDLPQRAKNN